MAIEGFPISPQQRRLWTLGVGSPALSWITTCSVAVDGPLDRERLRVATAKVVRRHEILRTTYRALPGMPFPLLVVQPQEGDGSLGLNIVEGGDARSRIEFSVPTLCSDRHGLESVVDEIFQQYFDRHPAAPPVQYPDAAEILNSFEAEASRDQGREKAGWLQAPALRMNGIEDPIPDAFTPEWVEALLHPEDQRLLELLPARHGLSPRAFLLSCWCVLLARSSGEYDFAVGVGCDGRTQEELDSVPGLFFRTVPFTVKVDGAQSISGFAAAAADALHEIEEGQDDYAWQELGGVNDRGSRRFYNWSFDYFESFVSCSDFGLTRIDSQHCPDRFQLKCDAVRSEPGRFRLRIYFDSSCVEPYAAARLACQYRNLLHSALNQCATPVHALDMLFPEERRSLLCRPALPETNTGTDLVHRAFERQAARTPDAIALSHEGSVVSFAALNDAANEIGHRLRSFGLRADVPIALSMERGVELIAAILGVLKAGAAYLPLDPSYPVERLNYMIDDARSPLVIVNRERSGWRCENVWYLRDASTRTAGALQNLDAPGASRNLAYVIYTSGSTGKPKGVAVAHRSVLNLWGALDGMVYGGPSPLRVTLNAAVSFDASVQQIVALLSGHCVEIIPQDLRFDGSAFVNYLCARGIDVFDCTPSHLRMLNQAGLFERSDAPSIGLVGGEPIDSGLWRLMAGNRSIHFYNVYGPTECTVDSTAAAISATLEPSIGKPLSNVQALILDRGLSLLPVGTAGELYLAGQGLGRGYLNRPGLSAERFVANPYGTPGDRMYRTGDLARWRDDGQIEFLGRTDRQVKVRGFRVELEEIEAVLLSQTGVDHAAVVPHDDPQGSTQLVAYLAGRVGPTDTLHIRERLADVLPEYMIPSAFLYLDKMVFTSSGKLDRLSLPRPELKRRTADLEPQTATEEIVAGIWEEVLRKDGIGAEDDFFELGGHSLSATQVITRIAETLRVEIPLRTIFKSPKLSSLAKDVDDARRRSSLESLPLLPRDAADARSLSYAQQRLWFLDQLEPGTALYNISMGVRLKEQLDLAGLQWTLSEIVNRHELLRTTFPSENGRAVQRVADPSPVSLPVIDVEYGGELLAIRVGAAEAKRPFDLLHGPVWRAVVLKLGREDYVLLVTMHHIIGDGWSTGVLAKELTELYNAWKQRRKPRLATLSVQYADYAAWQREWISGEVLQGQLEFWKNQLDGMTPLDLPLDKLRPSVLSRNGRLFRFRTDDDLSGRIRALSRREGASIFMTLLAAFHLLMARYSGQWDIAVGSPVAGRTRLETENLIGLFVNTLVFRVKMNPKWAFRRLLEAVREVTLDADERQDLPFEKIVDEIAQARELNRSPLFQVMFALQNATTEGGRLSSLGTEVWGVSQQMAKFDLTLTVVEERGDFFMALNYATDLFEGSTIERIARHYVQLLTNITENPDVTLWEARLLSEPETLQILRQWNATEAPVTKSTVLDCFEDQVNARPDAVAVVYGAERLSYAALNDYATRAAAGFGRRGIGPETKVGIYAHRSVETVASVLAVLKAGATYVPMDPAWPRQRLKAALDDAQPALVLTENLPDAEFIAGIVSVLSLDEVFENVSKQPALNGYSAPRLFPQSAAYVIYTSGSTGRPKGVVVEHRQLLNYVEGVQSRVKCAEGTQYGMLQPLTVDSAATVLFMSLTKGGCLHVITEESATDAAAMEDYFLREPIDCLKIAPSHLRALQQGCIGPEHVMPDRLLILGGEASPDAWVDDIKQLRQDCEIFNHYGPTEATVGVLMHRRNGVRSLSVSAPIGSPLANARAYVLDSMLQPVPIGAAGELYIAGAPVARGYLNRPSGTAAWFIADPYGSAGERMYRTGDMVRWRVDGNLEFLGRQDHQVKLRGYRIELGEIEAALTQSDAVAEAVVVLREDEPGRKRLVAYVVPRTQTPAPSELRKHLLERIPDYMIPAVYVFVDKLPLSAHGKLDRSALPSPDTSSPAAHEQPRTPVEEALIQIWSRVLRSNSIGIHDNFFDAGGDSILSIQIVAAAVQAGIHITARHLFQYQTIAALAESVSTTPSVRGGRGTALPVGLDDELIRPRSVQDVLAQVPFPPAQIEALYPLSPLQEGLLFHTLETPGAGYYLTQTRFQIFGNFDRAAFDESWRRTIQRHSALRAVCIWSGLDAAVQVVRRTIELPLQQEDWSALTDHERELRIAEFLDQDRRRSFAPSGEPLFRLALIHQGRGSAELILTVHHMLLDGWSTVLLLKEVGAYYRGLAEGKELVLAPAPVYRHYMEWLQERDREGARRYWRTRLAGYTEPALLPRYGAGQEQDARSEKLVRLPEALTSEVKRFARQHQLTVNTVLQGAWARLLAVYTGSDDVVFGTTVSGRPGEVAGIEQMIGLFINTVPVRVKIERDAEVSSWLRGIQSELAEAQQHAFVSLRAIQGWSDVPRGTPLFETLFVFENYAVNAFEEAYGSAPAPRNNRGASLRHVRTEGKVHYPLTLQVSAGEHLDMLLQFDSKAFTPEWVEAWLRRYEQVLRAMVLDGKRPLAAISLLSEQERRDVETIWHGSSRDYGSTRCIHEQCEEQAASRPDGIALVFDDQHLSYGELFRSSTAVAHRLRELGVGPEVCVGLFAERSVEMIVGMIGILLAGGAYVPLEPTHPADRLRTMIQSAGITVVATQKKWMPLGLSDGVSEIGVEDAILSGSSSTGQIRGGLCAGGNLAYVIYTSGSTGKPKGVAVPHSNVVRLLKATEKLYGFGSDDVWTLFHSYGFDFSVWEIFGALCYGGRLVVVPYETSRTPLKFYDLLRDEQVTVLNQTPTAFQQIAGMKQEGLAVRWVVFGGEGLEVGEVTGWVKSGKRRVVNMYGITETTVHVTAYEVKSGDRGSRIGEVLEDLEGYVLDEWMEPAPEGVEAELYVGGAGLARGYLKRPELTAERFVPNPYGGRGERLYRTGDVVRRVGRELEYVGRADEQVKLRGYRIELGEIESVLKRQPGVEQAVVVLREDDPGVKRLVAYVVGEELRQPSAESLRKAAGERLPEYMVPSAYVYLERLPLTANGKVDRKGLPKPERKAAKEGGEPRSEVERILAEIWEKVLRAERVGIEDNFFELGGDSILSIQIVTRANQEGIDITPRQLFQHQTIAELAEVAKASAAVEAEQGIVQGAVPLTPIQHWLFENEEMPTHYNQAVLLRSRKQQKAAVLEEVMKKMLEHHDALRLRFRKKEGVWEQWNAEAEGNRVVGLVDLREIGGPEQRPVMERGAAEMQASLDLERGPLLRVAQYRLGEEERMLVAVHHLAMDGVSWRILLEDMARTYGQLENGEPVKLPAKTTSYRQWGQVLEERAAGGELMTEKGYWMKVAREGVWKLPRDHDGENRRVTQRMVRTELDVERTQALLQELPKAYRTQIQEVLLAALGEALNEWAGRPGVVVDVEGHGREEVGGKVNVSRTVGWFTAIYPVALKHEGKTLVDRLEAAKQNWRQIPRGGIGYGMLKHLVKDETLAGLRADVSFNYLGQLDSAIPQESLWMGAPESGGPSQDSAGLRHYPIEIAAQVVGGRFHAGWRYSPEIHDEARISAAARRFILAIDNLIYQARTAPQEDSNRDVIAMDLTPEELDDVVQGIDAT